MAIMFPPIVCASYVAFSMRCTDLLLVALIDGQQLFALLADLICRRTLFLDLGLLLLLLAPQAVLLAELQLQLVTQLLQLLHLIFIILCDAVRVLPPDA